MSSSSENAALLPISEFSPERAEMLAKLIESLPHTTPEWHEGFNMRCFSHACGTPCCIAGWAASLMGMPARDANLGVLIDFLGCTFHESARLVYGSFSNKWRSEITPKEAAAAIRELITDNQNH